MANHYDLGKILTDTECEDLALEVLHGMNIGSVQLEGDARYYKNSYGGSTPGGWDALARFTPLASEITGKNLQGANPYARVYYHESTLNPHTDRQGLDWTLSVCLFSNIDKPWPLIVQDEGGLAEFPTAVGHASLVKGGTLTHWREQLLCDEHQYVVQMFLHWTELP